MIRIASTLQSSGAEIKWICRSSRSDSSSTGFDVQTINPIIKSGPFFYLLFNWIIFWKLVRSKTNLIYAVDLDTLMGCYLASKIKGITIMYDAHENYTEVPELLKSPMKKKIWKSLESWITPNLKYNITVNQSLAQIFKNQTGQTYHIIRNLPKGIVDKKQTTVNMNQLVYLGAVNQGRGVELAIEALVKLTSYTLLVIGDGDLLKDMKRLAQDLNVEARVNFTGYVDPSEIFGYLKASYLGLNILDPNSGNYFHSLANKCFDYIQAELPAIHMSFPEYKSIVNEYQIGLLIDDYTIQSLVDTILKLEKNRDLYQAIKKACLRAKEVYTWETESKKLVKIIQRIN